MSGTTERPSAADLRDELGLSAALTAEGFGAPGGRPGEQSLAAASDLVRTADRTLHLFVTQEREAGSSWADIGRVLGISRQAAQRRFGAAPSRRAIAEVLAPDPALVARAVEVLDHAAAGRAAPIQAMLGPGLRASLGQEGIAPAIAGIAPVFGEHRSRSEVSARVLAHVTVVTAREQWTQVDAQVRVTLAPDGALMGLLYEPVREG